MFVCFVVFVLFGDIGSSSRLFREHGEGVTVVPLLSGQSTVIYSPCFGQFTSLCTQPLTTVKKLL